MSDQEPEEKLINPNTACRACLGYNGNSNIFKLKFESSHISEIFEKCTRIKLEDDRMPAGICKICFTELTRTYKFIKKCQTTDAILKRHFNKQKFSTSPRDSDNLKELSSDNSNLDDSVKSEMFYLGDSSSSSNDDTCGSPFSFDCALPYLFEGDVVEEDRDKNKIDNLVKIEIFEEVQEDTKCDMPFVCGICNQGFLVQEVLDTHMKNHDSKPPPSIPKFTKKSGNDEVKIINSPKIIRGKCSNEVPAPDATKFQCNICDKEMNTRKALLIHLLIHKKSHVCPLCQKAFVNRGTLDEHMNVHTGLKPYGCHLCPKTFRQKHSLRVHIRFHKGIKNYHCEVCGKGFVRKEHYKQHMVCHSEEKPYTCEKCEKGFRFKNTLLKHLTLCGEAREPNNIELYPCICCGKLFKQMASLNSHMLIHTGEKPFECQICEASFLYIKSAKSHLSKDHGIPYEEHKHLIRKQNPIALKEDDNPQIDHVTRESGEHVQM